MQIWISLWGKKLSDHAEWRYWCFLCRGMLVSSVKRRFLDPEKCVLAFLLCVYNRHKVWISSFLKKLDEIDLFWDPSKLCSAMRCSGWGFVANCRALSKQTSVANQPSASVVTELSFVQHLQDLVGLDLTWTWLDPPKVQLLPFSQNCFSTLSAMRWSGWGFVGH